MSDEETEKPDDRSRIRPWHVVIIFLAIPALHIASGFVTFSLFDDWEKRGQFGDLFGAVNALFSGLAFAGVIVTILLQREELRLQRLELRLTRKELKRSAVAQEASERALSAQAQASWLSARLASTNALLEYYSSQLKPLESVAILPESARLRRIELKSKISALSERLDQLFSEIDKFNDGGGDA